MLPCGTPLVTFWGQDITPLKHKYLGSRWSTLFIIHFLLSYEKLCTNFMRILTPLTCSFYYVNYVILFTFDCVKTQHQNQHRKSQAGKIGPSCLFG